MSAWGANKPDFKSASSMPSLQEIMREQAIEGNRSIDDRNKITEAAIAQDPPPYPVLSSEEEDLQLALTLQAIEDEEAILAQIHSAKQIEAAKQSGIEKIRIAPSPSEAAMLPPSNQNLHGSARLVYSKGIEEIEAALGKAARGKR